MKRFAWLILGILLSVSAVLTGCEGDDDGGGAEVVGCNQVRYQGHTYTFYNVNQGVASFDAQATDTDAAGQTHQAAFHITCSGGCIATATPIEW